MAHTLGHTQEVVQVETQVISIAKGLIIKKPDKAVIMDNVMQSLCRLIEDAFIAYQILATDFVISIL